MHTAAPHSQRLSAERGAAVITTRVGDTVTGMATALEEVADAYEDRAILAERLARQNARLGEVVRKARAEGHPWKDIAAHAGTSEVAVYNASRKARA